MSYGCASNSLRGACAVNQQNTTPLFEQDLNRKEGLMKKQEIFLGLLMTGAAQLFGLALMFVVKQKAGPTFICGMSAASLALISIVNLVHYEVDRLFEEEEEKPQPPTP